MIDENILMTAGLEDVDENVLSHEDVDVSLISNPRARQIKSVSVESEAEGEIKNKFLYFLTYDAFNEQLQAGNINSGSIVFVDDRCFIWTHGKEYCSADLPLERGNGANSIKQKVSNPTYTAYNDVIKADGNNSFTWSRGCYGTKNYQFNAGGLLGSCYLTSSGDNYIFHHSETIINFTDITSALSSFYYIGYVRDLFVGLHLYDTSTFKCYGKIGTIVSFDETKPYEFVFSLDTTESEISLGVVNNKQVVVAVNSNLGSHSDLIGNYCRSNGLYSSCLGEGLYSKGTSNSIIGDHQTCVGGFSTLLGKNNLAITKDGFGNGFNNIIGVQNTINKSTGKFVFGYNNTINKYYGEAESLSVFFDTVIGNNNNISTRGVFVGETMNSSIKSFDQYRYMFGGFLNDNVDGKKAVTIVGQFNENYSPDATWVMASGNRSGNVRHNSLEVLHANNTFTTVLKDKVQHNDDVTFKKAVTFEDLTQVDGATALNAHYTRVTTRSEQVVTQQPVYYYSPDTITLKKGQFVKATAHALTDKDLAILGDIASEAVPTSVIVRQDDQLLYKVTEDAVVEFAIWLPDGSTEQGLGQQITIDVYDTIESLSERISVLEQAVENILNS